MIRSQNRLANEYISNRLYIWDFSLSGVMHSLYLSNKSLQIILDAYADSDKPVALLFFPYCLMFWTASPE